MPDTLETMLGTPEAYERPALIVLGDLAELTQGETGGGNDVNNIAT